MDIEKELKKVFDDYMKERAYIPEYAKILAEEYPEFLIKWFDTRRTFRGKGVLPEKFKELIMAAGAACRMVEKSTDAHMQTAMKHGATKQEILEMSLCVWLIGGMPSLSLCMSALGKLLKKEEETKKK